MLMRRSMLVAAALCTVIGCSGSTRESSPEGLMKAPNVAPDVFVGAWRSVTPSLEFIRLGVYSKSSQIGAIAAQLTLSGTMREGAGRIAGDSLVVDMAMAGTSQPAGVLMARSPDGGQTLDVQLRSDVSAPLALRFVRDR